MAHAKIAHTFLLQRFLAFVVAAADAAFLAWAHLAGQYIRLKKVTCHVYLGKRRFYNKKAKTRNMKLDGINYQMYNIINVSGKRLL